MDAMLLADPRACCMCCRAQVWLGYQQSLRPVQGALSLNVDLAATAFLEVPSLLRITPFY